MLTVNEVFFSIQGEGTRAGQPCVFLRLTGCPLRCVWCDTAYAFHEGQKRGEDDVMAELARFPTRLLCLTGGEPLAQPAAFGFVGRLLDAGWDVLVETSGHVPLDALDPRAVAIMDVKTPGSGESARMEWRNLDLLKATDEVKFVIDGRGDYEWARDLVRERRLSDRCAVLFSPVHGVLEPGALGRWILDDGLPVRLQVQLHKYLWPGAERGV
jgi:7-carboxy-7-deazaguanine synthase